MDVQLNGMLLVNHLWFFCRIADKISDKLTNLNMCHFNSDAASTHTISLPQLLAYNNWIMLICEAERKYNLAENGSTQVKYLNIFT